MTRSGPRLSERARDGLLAAALALTTVVWMLSVEGRQGIGRDEAQYMRAGEHHWGWFAELGDNLRAGHPRASFSRSGIDRFWSDNAPDHPVVMKVLYGMSWRLFNAGDAPAGVSLHPIPPRTARGTFPIFRRPSTAFRLPAILMAGLLAALVFAFAREFVGRAAASAASALTIAQPHYFFHAQIACFDAPITTMAVLVGFAYWKSLRSARWGVLTGVLFGVALGVKHNAWLMPIFLVGHYLWMRRRDLLRRPRRLPPVPLAFAAMLLLGPPIFVAHWPWLWSHPVDRTRAYVLRHLEHEHYNFEYLGRNWNLPATDRDLRLLRMTFPFVSTAVTLPVTTLALAGAGAVLLARRRRRTDDGSDDGSDDVGSIAAPDPSAAPVVPDTSVLTAATGAPPAASAPLVATVKPGWQLPGAGLDRAPGAFFLVQILGPMAILALPSAPIFGGVKHFMPAFPFIALLAAIGLSWLGNQLITWARSRAPWFGSERLPAAVPAMLAVLVSLPALAETRRSHPDGLSHYNLLAGGFAGGASLGMNRQFWGYAVLPMLDVLAANAPARANTYWHDVMPDAINMYIRDRRLPPFSQLGNTGVGEDAIRRSDLGIIVHEKHMRLYEGVFWENYGTTQPVYVRTREGVPLVTVYRRPGAQFHDVRIVPQTEAARAP